MIMMFLILNRKNQGSIDKNVQTNHSLEIQNTYDIPCLNVCQSSFIESTFTGGLGMSALR